MVRDEQNPLPAFFQAFLLTRSEARSHEPVREAKALRERGVPAERVRTVAVGESVMLSH